MHSSVNNLRNDFHFFEKIFLKVISKKTPRGNEATT